MRRILIIAAFLLLPGICLVAQQYPVQVTPQLVPPYTLQVSGYYSAIGSPKLNLLLLLRDFNKPSLQVRLRMSITSQSVAIVTREDVSFTAIEILSGQPKYIQPADLTEYFNSNNLTFSGITQSQYQQTGKLPEGFYTFCFEVVDVVTGQTVSNKGCTIAWLTLSEPPLLNIPRKAEALIPVIEPAAQNVSFQWTPRHTASPTAYTIDYNFKLVELPLGTTSPEADFASYPAIYEENTAITTILYDGIGAKPRLKPGYTYAWQVQAKAKSGTQDVAMFRNNGFSEIFWFVYQNNCPVPTSINATAQGQRVNITWSDDVQHLDYKVEYRKINTAGAEWFELGNTTPNVSITDLEPSTTYEYRVGAACEYGKFIFSPLQQFASNSETATTVPQCGFDPNPAPTTEPLLQQMNVGDVIKAGDFDVVITKVTGSSNFSGRGYVVVPWLANMKLGVSFENIQVATDKKLKNGQIVTTYDPTEGGIADVDEAIDLVGDIIKEIADLVRISIDRDYKEIKELIDKIKVEVREQMPDSLFQEYEATLNTLDSAKLAYDNLKNTYATASDAEKGAVYDEMRQAEKTFVDAQDKLRQLNEEKEKVVADIVEILIQAARKLRNEQFSDDKIAQLKSVNDQKMQALDQLVEQTKQTLQGYTQAPATDSVLTTGSVISVIMIEDDVQNVEGQPGFDFKKAELDFNVAIAVKAFASSDNKIDSYKLILQYLKTGTENYTSYVTRKLQDGVSKDVLINETKAILLTFINQLLEGEIINSK